MLSALILPQLLHAKTCVAVIDVINSSCLQIYTVKHCVNLDMFLTQRVKDSLMRKNNTHTIPSVLFLAYCYCYKSVMTKKVIY